MLVFGGASGIGSAVVRALAARVAITPAHRKLELCAMGAVTINYRDEDFVAPASCGGDLSDMQSTWTQYRRAGLLLASR